MNRILIVALVACMVLFILAVLIAPTVDLQPSALRAQQWSIAIAAMFSIAGLFQIFLQIVMVPAIIGPALFVGESPQRVSSLDLSCCLLC
jgi:hypothetical protein